ATSKIQKAEDLAAIATMGFRGEALPSIASVSRFTLTSRQREGDSPEASQVIVHGGKIIEVKSAGHAPGTSVEVRQLFYNLPARLAAEGKVLPADLSGDSAGPEEPGELPEYAPSGAGRSTLRIRGFIGAPGVSRATRQDQHLFVNRRPVENRALNYALLEGYH